MENIKESLANIKKHLKRMSDIRPSDNPTMYISDFEHIINVLNICVDENKTMLGLGFRNYSSTKEYKDFPASEMLDKGFLVSDKQSNHDSKNTYVIFCDKVNIHYGTGNISNCCIVTEKESVEKTKESILNALEEYLDKKDLELRLPELNSKAFLGLNSTPETNYYYYIQCLSLK